MDNPKQLYSNYKTTDFNDLQRRFSGGLLAKVNSIGIGQERQQHDVSQIGKEDEAEAVTVGRSFKM